ncbi:unnamed protein product, partial [Scytosiphon promiscuus]
PALLRALRALRRRDDDGGGGGGGGRSSGLRLAKEVMELLRLLVKAGPNSDLRRLLFSNFSFLLSFLELDASAVDPTPPSQKNAAGPPATSRGGSAAAGEVGSGGKRSGGRRLYFASPVARLMGAVIDEDFVLVTSISDEHLTQLAMAATRSREADILRLLQKLVTCKGTPVQNMQRRVLVSLLRELSRSDFHAAFGWDDLRPRPSVMQPRHRAEEPGPEPHDTDVDDSLVSGDPCGEGGDRSLRVPAPPSPRGRAPSVEGAAHGGALGGGGRRGGEEAGAARVGAPPVEDEFPSNVNGVFGGDGGSGKEEYYPFGEQGQRQEQEPSGRRPWRHAEGSATSGLGFMSALQRAIILEQQPQQQAEGGGGGGNGGDGLGGDPGREGSV